MQTIQAFIMQACEDSGEVSYRSYSGRGMFGRNCVGISSSRQQCMAIVNAVNSAMIQELFDAAVNSADNKDAAYDLNDQVQKAIDQLLSFETDSMGYDIIMYWPEMEFVAEDNTVTDEWIDQQSESTLSQWVAENCEYHGDEDVESLKALRATVRVMRDRMVEDQG